MPVIYKYPVELKMTLELPLDATVLTVQMQHGTAQMWVLLNPEAPTTPRHFTVYGTGQTIPKTVTAATYIGTFQVDHGALIFHLFETIA